VIEFHRAGMDAQSPVCGLEDVPPLRCAAFPRARGGRGAATPTRTVEPGRDRGHSGYLQATRRRRQSYGIVI